MSLVIVISENAINSLGADRDQVRQRFEALARGEIFVHDTRDIYWESGITINPGMVVTPEDRLDQAYYQAMADLAAGQLPGGDGSGAGPGAGSGRIAWS